MGLAAALVGCGGDGDGTSTGGTGSGTGGNASATGGSANGTGGSASGGNGDGTGGESTGTGGGNSNGPSCTGQTGSCSSVDYGMCVEVRSAPGHCVDWSTTGATPCVGVEDCPTDLPSGTFATGTPDDAGSLCVAQDGTLQVGGVLAPDNPQPGFCAAFQVLTDPSKQASCETTDCGTGYCSHITNDIHSVVTCTWPL